MSRGAYAQTAAWVNSHVEWATPASGSAQSTVVGWENSCTDDFNAHKGDNDTQRNIVNNSAYLSDVWLSRSGDPQNKVTTPITAGTSIPMQINDMDFICAIVTMNPSGFAIAPAQQVSNARYPNDRAPVPDSNDAQYKINQASRYESNDQINSVTVAAGDPGSIGAAPSPVNRVLSIKRDNNSRYWDGTTAPFTYNVPAGLAPGTHTVTIKVVYTPIKTYHDYGASGTSRCTLKSNGQGVNIAYGDYNACIQYTENYQFTFTVVQPQPPYNLVPQPSAQITENGNPVTGSTAQVGDVVTFTYAIQNTGGDSDGSTACNIYANSHVGAFTIPNPVENSSNIPYVPPAINCAVVFKNGTTTIIAVEAPITITGADVNHTLCRSLWVDPAKPGGQPLGQEVCIQVAAKPFVKVFGGDVSVGNNFGTSCTQNATAGITAWNTEAAGGYAGSGSQFAVKALTTINDFASGQNAGGVAPPYGLSFANTNRTTSVFGGNFGSLGDCLTDYYGNMPSTAVTKNAAQVASLDGLGSGVFKETGDVTIAGNIVPGQKTVLYVKGNVTINGPIKYTGSPWAYNQVPLFELIVQGNIYVRNTVSEVAGTFIAQPNGANGGAIYTCALADNTPLTLSGTMYTPCAANQLTINGQFISNQVYLLRTKYSLSPDASAGETNTTGKGAEVFDFTPANWMTQPPAGSNNGGYDAISSLPPVL